MNTELVASMLDKMVQNAQEQLRYQNQLACMIRMITNIKRELISKLKDSPENGVELVVALLESSLGNMFVLAMLRESLKHIKGQGKDELKKAQKLLDSPQLLQRLMEQPQAG